MKTLKETRNSMVLGYLEHFGNNRAHTAIAMGISTRTLSNYIKEMKEEGHTISRAHFDPKPESEKKEEYH